MADESYGNMHGRMEYMRGRHEALEDRVDRLEGSINKEIASMNGKLDSIFEHIAGQKGQSSATAALWSVFGTGIVLLAVELIKRTFLH